MKAELRSAAIVLLLVSLAVAGTLFAGGEKPVVYVAVLPPGTRATAAIALAREVRAALERRGAKVLAEASGSDAAALEAITSASNAGGAQVSLAVRLVPSRTSCVTVRT